MNLFTELSTGLQRRLPAVHRALSGLLLGAAIGLVAPVSAQVPGPPGRPVEPKALAERAAAGDPWAQLNLGAAYDNGLTGYPLDPVLAVGWYRRAAEAGLAEAQFNLAHCLVTGNGTTRDDGQAFGWMLRAAEQGLASAQYLAGVMLIEGIGTDVDRGRASIWLRRAADNGNLDAASMLQRLQAESGE